MSERTPIGDAESEHDVKPLIPFEEWLEQGGDATEDSEETRAAISRDEEVEEVEGVDSRWGDLANEATASGNKAKNSKPPNSTIPRPWSGLSQDIKASGGKEQKALLQKMKGLVPYRWNAKREAIRLTPLVQFYMVRYLGPILYEHTDAALTRLPIRASKKATSKKLMKNRIRSLIRQVKMKENNLTSEPLTPPSSEGGIDLDIIFPFHRLKTLMGKDGAPPQFGMMQEYYSLMKSNDKASMIEAITNLHRITPEELTEDGNYIIPKEGYLEPFCAWLEKTAPTDSKSISAKFFDDPYADKPKKILRGALLEAPGLRLILSETAGNHRIFKSHLPDGNQDMDLSSIEDLQGFDYLVKLTELIYNSGEDRYELKNTLDEILYSYYDVIITNLAQEVTAIVIADDIEYRTLIQFKPPPYPKGIDKKSDDGLDIKWRRVTALEAGEKFQGKNLTGLMMLGKFTTNLKRARERMDADKDALQWVFSFNEDFTEIDTIFAWKTSGNTTTDEGENGWMVLVTEEGMDEQQAEPQEAEMFNAAGQIVEQIMLDNAVEASSGTDKSPVTTRYDETVAALLGNSSFPGIATYHALWHFNYLVAQLKNPFSNWNIEKEGVMGGRLLAVEAYFGSPSKLLLYWLLNFRGYIDWGATQDDGTPLFFQPPTDAVTQLEISAYEKNKLSHLMISYYRLAFAMLATREVITTTRVKPKKAADIKEYWKKLVADANNDPPAADKFVMALTYSFGSIRDQTARRDIPHPTWMPPPSESIEMKSKQYSQELVSKYLKWAYGQRPVDITWFGEVAAAYHAAKAISSGRNYSEMVEKFIEAVDQDGGHAFLFAILLNPKSERQAIPERPPQTMVIKDVEKIGGRDDFFEASDGGDSGGPRPPSDPPPSETEVIEVEVEEEEVEEEEEVVEDPEEEVEEEANLDVELERIAEVILKAVDVGDGWAPPVEESDKVINAIDNANIPQIWTSTLMDLATTGKWEDMFNIIENNIGREDPEEEEEVEEDLFEASEILRDDT